ncbi:MAG: mechanosensitive ion channel family protein [Caulobacteraceae bacterium]
MTNLNALLTTQLLRLGNSAVTVGGLITAAIIVLAAVVVARLVRFGIERLRGKAGRSAQTLFIVEKLVGYGVIILGVFLALNAAGLNLSTFAVFAGAIGVGVGLGLQGVVKEFVSGLVLIFDRVLNIGDYVEIEGGARGTVHEIGPRATRIRTNDNIDILVPNSKLVENPVTNWTFGGEGRRIHIPFGVAYGADKEKVREVVLAAAAAVPFTLPEEGNRKSQVWLTGLGESGLNFELLVWPTLDAVKRPAAMQAAYTWAIEDALRYANIEMPYPQMEVRVRSLFGLEDHEALKALKLEPAKAPPPPAPAAPPPSSSNDAVDELMSGGGADLEPPEEAEPKSESA